MRAVPFAFAPWVLFSTCALQCGIHAWVPRAQVRHELAMRIDTSAPADWAVVPRALTALFAHADAAHLLGNVVTTAALGVFLEGMHGPLRAAAVYFGGGVGGVLFYRAGWCVAPPAAPLVVVYVGSSPAAYALAAALLAHMGINWRELGALKHAWLAAFAACCALEFVLVWLFPQPQVAYRSHAGGALFGVAIGVLVLRNVRFHPHEALLYLAAALGAGLLGAAVVLACHG